MWIYICDYITVEGMVKKTQITLSQQNQMLKLPREPAHLFKILLYILKKEENGGVRVV